MKSPPQGDFEGPKPSSFTQHRDWKLSYNQLPLTFRTHGNKQLKRAFFLSAVAALADPASRAYYDKKIAQGKHHTQALLCLARRRADVLFAMLRDGTFYEPQPARSA